LEKGRGFLVYFCRTYSSFVPFLKGIHLTLDSWRKNRDIEGWKVKPEGVNNEAEDYDFNEEALKVSSAGKWPEPISLKDVDPPGKLKASNEEPIAPDYVTAVPRLHQDLIALSSLLDRETAPWRFIRGDKVGTVHYGFGDAAKSGFGSTFEDEKGNVWFQLGVWGNDTADLSSNWRELSNLVESLEARAEDNTFRGIEIFIFTDNSTAEAAFYRGTSSLKKLFDLILKLKMLELSIGCVLHVIHVSGRRMIAQGTDGTSRGDLGEGVMKGKAMLSYIPLHLSALERCPALKEEIRRWIIPSLGKEEVIFLEYADWFERGHDIVGGKKNADGVWIPTYRAGTYIWTPPPAGGQLAVEQLRRARLKREDSTHVVIIPRLMMMEWKRQLFRVADFYIELPFNKIWSIQDQHEPLTFAVVLPFLKHRPWQLKRSQAFLGLGNVLRRLWKESEIPPWDFLRKFFEQSRKLENLPEGVVRKMLQSPSRFGFSYP
jgi:hypothetical protein